MILVLLPQQSDCLNQLLNFKLQLSSIKFQLSYYVNNRIKVNRYSDYRIVILLILHFKQNIIEFCGVSRWSIKFA